ncbi:hypothetical protein Enr10x_18940 [Gimesia panareensis]|uniref:Uncharacterized protein n=2 Tax=Gimesia panareensis TaxID=2527978 RepID=A0A517Q4P3_9PLAN|nr:hypothetical protein Enr10x_18940 [Gimesia panareensis]QDU50531.1 hypothetical protein Pan110_28830 [Gimesia panareensis]
MTVMKNSPDNINKDDASDLEWLAFQYVSNELSETESQEFETLLAEQQSARDALVSATQLVAGLKSIEPQPALQTTAETSRTVSSSRLAFWGLLTSAAAILLLVPTLFKTSGTTDSPAVPVAQAEPSPEDVEHLLDLWSDSSTENSVAVSLNTGSEALEFSDQQNVLADNQSLEVPDWLYTAVSLPEESVN